MTDQLLQPSRPPQCYSGWMIFIALSLICTTLNVVGLYNYVIGTLLLVSAIGFYMFQNKLTNCRYPDPNA